MNPREWAHLGMTGISEWVRSVPYIPYVLFWRIERKFILLRSKEKTMEKAREKYEAYDSSWKKEFFDERTGGYVVVHIERVKHSHLSKNERTIYEKEIEMVKVFARNGHQIEMLPEIPRFSSHDVNIDGIPAELKRISSENNIVKAASKAIHKQKAKMVLFQFDKRTDRIYLELLKLKRRKYKVFYFFTGEEKVHTL